MKEVLDRARIDSNDAVLDVGTEQTAALIARCALDCLGADGSVICLDVSVDVLDELRAACPDPRVSFLVGSVDVVPLPDVSVDVVLGCPMFGSTSEKVEAAREAHRVLRRGGRISLFEPDDAEGAEAWLAEAGFTAIDAVQRSGLFLAGAKT